MTKRHAVLRMFAALLALLILAPAAVITAQAADTLELTGSLHGAPYKILVPENWNGTLLVYAHGYSAVPVESPDAAFLGGPPKDTPWRAPVSAERAGRWSRGSRTPSG